MGLRSDEHLTISRLPELKIVLPLLPFHAMLFRISWSSPNSSLILLQQCFWSYPFSESFRVVSWEDSVSLITRFQFEGIVVDFAQSKHILFCCGVMQLSALFFLRRCWRARITTTTTTAFPSSSLLFLLPRYYDRFFAKATNSHVSYC